MLTFLLTNAKRHFVCTLWYLSVFSIADDITVFLFSSCLHISSQVRDYFGAQGQTQTPLVRPALLGILRRLPLYAVAPTLLHLDLNQRMTCTQQMISYQIILRSFLSKCTHRWSLRRPQRSSNLKAKYWSWVGDRTTPASVLQASS